jgi:KTSC domain
MTAELTRELARITGGINIEYRINTGLVPKILVLALLVGFVAQYQNTTAHATTPKLLVWVKYRQTPVDLVDRRFEYLDTSRSSFITGAWYDSSNSYMVIGLRGTYYHYCRMPRNAWNSFRGADSFGRHYNAFIKGNYDCRLRGVPVY